MSENNEKIYSTNKTGLLTELTTTEKTTLVGAVNEINGSISSVKEDLNQIWEIDWISGSYISGYGDIVTGDVNRMRTDYIPVIEGMQFSATLETNHQNISAVTFYNGSKNVVQTNVNADSGGTPVSHTYTVPASAEYMILSSKTNIGKTMAFDTPVLSSVIENMPQTRSLLTTVQNGLIDVTTKNLANSSAMVSRSLVTETDGVYTIAPTGYMFGDVRLFNTFTNFARIQFKGTKGSSGLFQYRLYNGSTFTTHYFKQNGEIYYADFAPSDFPSSSYYIKITFDNRQDSANQMVIKELVCWTDKMFIGLGDEEEIPETVYIAPTGNDTTGNGTSAYPLATVNKALSLGASKVMVKAGVYKQIINFAYAQKDNISIVSDTTDGRAIFVHPDAFMSDTEEVVSGYTNVYSFEYAEEFSSLTRLYQDGIPDASTLITDAERNPYQRGQECRCLDTKIVRCSASTLNDALAEIDDISNGYKYYHDTTNGVVYFSRPQSVSTSNPIMKSVASASFLFGLSRRFNIHFYGIESKYMTFNVGGSVAHIEDCKSANVCGAGCFVYDKCLSTEFVRCEASGAYLTTTGDGFNGHSTSTGDKYSKQTVVRLVDCWSHDNLDDGYSDHERSEIEIYGGLYEYNGKAGITPSYGSHCSCYGVVSRNNYNGFYYIGEATAEEGGKYGQMMCIDCLAENNTKTTNGNGFAVDGAGNSVTLINCKAISNLYGFYATSDTIMRLIDCGALDNTSGTKHGTGSFVIQNTTLVQN